MKVGDVISNKRGLWVIIQISNGDAVDSEPLQEFIVRNTVIKFNGELRNLKEIIEIQINEYLSKKQVIEE